jgi:hypothetical protein
MTEEEISKFFKEKIRKVPNPFKGRPVHEVMAEYKDRLYQRYQEVVDEIGHVPVVSIERHHELKKKYGDKDPSLDLSRFDMKLPDQLMDNGTLDEACDICESSGSRWRGRTGWERGVYVLGPKTNYSIRWTQEYIVAANTGKVGLREAPAYNILEAKKIAEGRNISVIRMRNDKAEYYPNVWYFERDRLVINHDKDPVVSYRRNGEWIDVEPSPLRSK